MRRLSSLLLVTSLVVASATGAEAQNFFERLFGIAPTRPAPPPVTYAPAPEPGAPADDQPRRQAAPPVQARPVSLRVPTEDGLIGRELKQNGTNGSLRIERTGRSDLRARLTLVGRRSAQSVETCTVSLGGQDGVTLVSQGRPDGLQRYQIQDATCPLQVDVLDEAVMVKGSGEACVFQAANCQVDASGVWGPEPAQLLARARDYESTRASADKAVRENYKVLVQRARPEGVRPIVAEQAAFSAEREVLCRNYAREASHSFCNARFSEARAITLAQRLGVTVASNQSPPAGGNEIRVRRRSDPYGMPSTDDLVQRNPFDDN